MIDCIRERLAVVSTLACGVIASLTTYLPHNWDDWASAVAIVAGLVGIGLSVQQFVINQRRWNRIRRNKR